MSASDAAPAEPVRGGSAPAKGLEPRTHPPYRPLDGPQHSRNAATGRKRLAFLSGTARSVLSGAGSSFAIKIAAVGIGFLVQLLLARALGAASYGDYVYALSWQNVLLLVGTLGYDVTALRFVAVYHGKREWPALRGFLLRSHRLVATSAIATALLGIGVVLLLRQHVRPELTATLIVAFLLVPFTALLQLQSLGLLGLRRIVMAQAPRDVLRPLLLGAGVLLVVVVARVRLTAATAMALNLVTIAPVLLITGWGMCRILKPSLHRVGSEFHAREWNGVAVSMFVIAGLHLLLERIDVLLIGALLSTREAGIYSVAQRITSLLAIGLSAVNAVAAPMIAALHASGEHDELQRTITIAIRGVLAFVLPTSALLILFGRQVLALFGAEFTGGFFVLVILTVGAVLNVTASLTGFLMTMTGHQRAAMRLIGASAAVTILLNLLLIPRFGITGAAAATVTALLLRNLALTFYVRRQLGIRTSPLAALSPLPRA